MPKYQNFIGDLKGSDLETAILTARKIKPDVRRLYIDAENNTLRYIVRKRMDGGSVINAVVHEVPISERDISDDLDFGTPHKGHMFCISIDAYEGNSKRSAERLGINMKYGDIWGYRSSQEDIFRIASIVSCPI